MARSRRPETVGNRCHGCGGRARTRWPTQGKRRGRVSAPGPKGARNRRTAYRRPAPPGAASSQDRAATEFTAVGRARTRWPTQGNRRGRVSAPGPGVCTFVFGPTARNPSAQPNGLGNRPAKNSCAPTGRDRHQTPDASGCGIMIGAWLMAMDRGPSGRMDLTARHPGRWPGLRDDGPLGLKNTWIC